jgi:carbon storage regulator
MLVLGRKAGERIYIGNDIYVVVQRVNGNTVRLAIEAPADVKILRGELVHKRAA